MDSNSFFTKTFYVRYAEELVVLRDIVRFRTEIDVRPDYLNTEFFLKAELYYQPPLTNNFARNMNSAAEMASEMQKSESNFKMVQARLYQINRGLMGVSSFMPVLFDREYTCLTMTTVHSSLMDYRFRLLPALNFSQAVQSSQKSKKKKVNNEAHSFELIELNKNFLEEEDQTFIENGIVVVSKLDLSEEEKQKHTVKLLQQRFQSAASSWQPQSIAEFLFYDDNGQLTISEERVKTLYQEFSSIL